MELYLITPCGCYGRAKGENFLRRRGTLEPVETPLKYYTSQTHHSKGNTLRAVAWSTWKTEHHPNNPRQPTPYFEVIDDELHRINNAIQSPLPEKFKKGVQMLKERLAYAIKAEVYLRDYPEASQAEKEQWLSDIRLAPSLLFKIFEDLEGGGGRMVEGQRRLAGLCADLDGLRGDHISSNTSSVREEMIQLPDVRGGSLQVPSSRANFRDEEFGNMPPPSSVRDILFHAPFHDGGSLTPRQNEFAFHGKRQGAKGGVFGLGHDPSDGNGGTVRGLPDMHAPSGFSRGGGGGSMR